MTYDGKMVKPDRRRGLIRVIADPQGMKQFQWVDADTKNPIDVSQYTKNINTLNRVSMCSQMISSLRRLSNPRIEFTCWSSKAHHRETSTGFRYTSRKCVILIIGRG